MIHDTFEANPGLCELFKRKIIERARSVGLSESLIDFEAQVDKKGTYQDNLRIFYRAYPQLSTGSDYFRIRSIRPLSGAALEWSWRSYEANNRAAKEAAAQPLTGWMTVPELTVTYSIGSESSMAPQNSETISEEATLSQSTNPRSSTSSELAKSILDRVTAMAGEMVTRTMLHQIGREIGKTAFHSSGKIPPENLAASLGHVLSSRGLGRLGGLEKTVSGSHVTYACTVENCSLCHEPASTRLPCIILPGIVSRWLESFLQEDAEGIDTACTVAGSHQCVIKVTFRK
jgi:hypothetical protein